MLRNTTIEAMGYFRFFDSSMRPKRNASEYLRLAQLQAQQCLSSMRPKRNASEYAVF